METSPSTDAAARRRCGCVAAGGTRTAGQDAADPRLPRRKHAFELDPLDQRLRAAIGRTRLDRRPHGGDRVSMGGGSSERFVEIATEFVRLKVDVIVTVGSAALAAKQVTSTVPIVFAA